MFPSRLLLLCLANLMLLLGATCAQAERPPSVDAEIEYLINRVEKSGAKFLRSGTEYSSAEAAAHLRKKLSSAGDRVKTTDDFINGIATKSYLNGKPYYLEEGGKQIPTGEWLKRALAAKRAGK